MLTAIVTGIAGGVFCWLLLNTARWIPAPLRQLHGERPVVFAALCGLVIAVVGLMSGGTTFGSGYAEARGLLDGHEQLSRVLSVPEDDLDGRLISAGHSGRHLRAVAVDRRGLRQLLHMVFGRMQLPMLIALAMVGYLAAVTQSPITSFVIVMEMIDGHALVISLMATALIASRVSRFFAPPLYEALAERYMAPYAAARRPRRRRKCPEALIEEEDAEPRN